MRNHLVKRQKLPLPLSTGRWRVIWFGKLASLPLAPSALGVHTYFLQVDVANEFRRIEPALVSLAHLPILHLGAEVETPSGEVSASRASNKLRYLTLPLDLRTSNTELVLRSSLDVPSIPEALAKSEPYDSLLIRVRATESAPEVLIPCSVLFLFFWGVSSTMIHAATTEWLLAPTRHLYVPDTTDLEADPVRFEVRKRWTDDEAPYLVTLLKDPEALLYGQRIFKRIVKERSFEKRDNFHLEVWPPFARLMNVSGLFGKFGDALLLTHITSSDVDCGWEHLELLREGGRHLRIWANSPDSGEGPPPSPPPAPGGTPLGPTRNYELQETPGGFGPGAAELPAVAPLESRFPSFSKTAVSKPLTSDIVEERVRKKRRKFTPGPFTAIEGSSHFAAGSIKGKLVGGKSASPTDSTPAESDVDIPVDSQLLRFAEIISKWLGEVPKHERPSQVDIDFWLPFNGIGLVDSPRLFSLPSTVDEQDITWLYRDPNRRRTKRGLCLRASYIDGAGTPRHRFIIDLERRIPLHREETIIRSPIHTGLMVVWFDRELDVHDTCIDLCEVLKEAARNRGPALPTRPFPYARVATIHHGSDVNHILSTALAAEDECNKPRRRRVRSIPSVST